VSAAGTSATAVYLQVGLTGIDDNRRWLLLYNYLFVCVALYYSQTRLPVQKTVRPVAGGLTPPIIGIAAV